MAIDLNPTNPIRDIRTLPGSKLPQVGVYSGFIDAQQIARKTLLRLASAFVCGARNESLQNIFIQDALWKDILSFSGDLRTFFSEALISITLTKLADIKRPYNFVLASLPLMEPRLVKVTEQLSAVKGARGGRLRLLKTALQGGQAGKSLTEFVALCRHIQHSLPSKRKTLLPIMVVSCPSSTMWMRGGRSGT